MRRPNEISKSPNLQISKSRGFTLVELLVVITIIAILIALLLPAVQAAREAARRVQCSNNLKQLGLATLHYENATGYFPKSKIYVSGWRHGWAASIFPYIEQEALASQYHWTDQSGNIIYWNDPLNKDVIRTPLGVMICPSVPGGERFEDITLRNGRAWKAAVSDYCPPLGVQFWCAVPWTVTSQNQYGALAYLQHVTAAEVRDGTSHTLLMIEVAGRPQHWIKSGPGPLTTHYGSRCHDVTNGIIPNAAWADPNNDSPVDGFSYDGLGCPGPCPFNCSNHNEGFAFHPGGMNVVLADGSVQFLPESMSLAVYAGMITRDNGEIIPGNAF